MSSAEFTAWQAYYRVEPFGDGWERTAALMALLANVYRNAKERKEPFRPAEFYPGWRPPPPPPDPWDQWRAAKRHFGLLGRKREARA